MIVTMSYDFSRIKHLWDGPHPIPSQAVVERLQRLDFLAGYPHTQRRLTRLETTRRLTVNLVIDQVISSLRADVSRAERAERHLEMDYLDAVLDCLPRSEKNARERALRDFQAQSSVLTTKELKARLADALADGPPTPHRPVCLVCGRDGRRYFGPVNRQNPLCADHSPSTNAGKRYRRMVAWAGGESEFCFRVAAAAHIAVPAADRAASPAGILLSALRAMGRKVSRDQFWAAWRVGLLAVEKEYGLACRRSRRQNVQKASAGRLASGKLGGRPLTVSRTVLKRAAGNVRRGVAVAVAANNGKVSVATLRRYLLTSALDAVKRGTPITTAAKRFGVRETTLRKEFMP